ncbi:hypothetical protein G1H11_05640 [Phytoactinopolyspora alkaliphila]|uniref:Uncharacterized protein n=1 Tax=Phytoactinopolyspora alkaliphila TaxID=1783498 RepID=A0A6N9YIU1_9ACTN|nr:DUF6578 domain-containing protein [Phytoactinopolyspora alkaliphila]NED94789.1 hypothetical protein [Phytoactinopolyspora alkaliphila]
MRIRVWVDSWQMQCCGDPFKDGGTVEWTLDAEPDVDWFDTIAGAKLATSIEYQEEHHGGLPDDAPATRGVVQAIYKLRCRYTPHPDRNGTLLVPVPGSATMTQIHHATGWEDHSSESRFVGYVVDLDVAERPPHTVRDPRH